ncbi:hypothetical protein SAMN02745221_00379 [Thermosyntropha lipolytica DSM 11003]|uniref:Uncharacterized protein n=1 Tax=Thermosyntropha lipolytica DSM 11003 TaxID=1123382 RepID=A0A1M5KHM6_9FIRM|nr:hypothetical protein [Thermosyntropha lipolytica]SHG52130.1 hypothetical protein SAMN02745221_00379 [Thermosyntropha lipolytica DSM 11003]
METKNNNSVPKYIYFVIPAILALMYFYAAFIDTSPAEKVVEDFYDAYFSRDYARVAQNLSVFWAVQFLPQYSTYSPAELLERREQVIKDIEQVITDIESQNKFPSDLTVNIEKKYSQKGKNSAIVAYSFIENGQKQHMEMAILIYEKGAFRIISFYPVSQEELQNITKEDMKNLDEQFSSLLNNKPARL